MFNDPESGRLISGCLSGKVRDKLAGDQQATVDDERFAVNVTALRAVQPPDPAESGALAVAP